MKNLIETAKDLNLAEARRNTGPTGDPKRDAYMDATYADDVENGTAVLNKNIAVVLKQLKKLHKDLLKTTEKEFGSHFENIQVWFDEHYTGANTDLRVSISGEPKVSTANFGGSLNISKDIRL
tara:strand:- start:286 stop:654 length:369 start_codon:yes stop_codon:yes gene_type:complete